MNKVSGRVLIQETRTGIPDLVVSVYAVDPRMPRADIGRLHAENFKDLITGSRLGSVVTDAGGAFGLEYEDTDFQGSETSGRPALLLVVVAPEGPGQKPCPPILHISCELRRM